MSETPLTRAVREILPAHLWLFGLQRWTVDIKEGKPDGSPAMIEYDAARRTAVIVFDPSKYPAKRGLYLDLWHELSHLVTAELDVVESQVSELDAKAGKVIAHTIESVDENVATTLPAMLTRLGIGPKTIQRRYERRGE